MKNHVQFCRLTRELDLDRIQQGKVLVVIEQRWKKMEQQRAVIHSVDRASINSTTLQELKNILTPDQQKKLVSLEEEMQRNRSRFLKENPAYVFSEDDKDLQIF